MTLQGADESKLARAVKHSMVVIDAEKHKLDYKQSEIDNNIKPENIKEKVSILGIEGSLIELNGEEITINSSREDKEIYPTEGKNAITKINLKAIKFNLQNKEIVENGKYTADKQYDGLGEVIINVQSAPVEQLYSYSEEVWN